MLNTKQRRIEVLMVENKKLKEALDRALLMYNEVRFDGEPYPCGNMPWCKHCSKFADDPCANAFIEFLEVAE